MRRDEYRAVREGVGFLDCSHRGKLEVTGPDRETFIHSMISNDVLRLPPYSGGYATFLTSTGKMVADLYYYKFPQFLIVDLDRALFKRTVETLEKFIVMDEVYLADRSAELDHFSWHGPASAQLAAALWGEPLPAQPLGLREIEGESGPLWLIFKPYILESGFDLVCPLEAGPALREKVRRRGEEFGLVEISSSTFETLRLEAGVPLYGVDMDQGNYPMEARLDHAISLQKGCYIGQEVVARATHIGGVARLLSRLVIEHDEPPPAGALVWDSDGKKLGSITSAVFSPRENRPLAFAYLRRQAAVAGRKCLVELESGARVPASVLAD